MNREQMVETILHYMCPFFSDGICRGAIRCHDDCIKRSFAKDAVNELIPDGAVVLTKEEYKRLKKEELYAQGKYNLCHGNRNIEAIAKTTEQTGQMLIDYDSRIRKAYDEIIPKLLEENKHARKETAREYHKKMTQEIELHNFENTSDYEYMNASNNEILKDFGVEVEG